MTVGQLVKTKRHELGVTQERLASMLGYTSKVIVAKIEQDCYTMTDKTVKDLAELLGVTEKELREGNDKPFVKTPRCRMKGKYRQSRIDANNKYQSNHYDYFKLRFYKGERDKYMQVAEEMGYDSFQQFCKEAIAEKAGC